MEAHTMMQALPPTLQTFAEQAEILRLAFLDRQGYPRVVPVWFVLIDGAYCIGIGTTSAKWKAMQRNSRVGWVIDGGMRGHYKGASMRGIAEEVREATWRARVYDALGKKYFGAASDAEFVNVFGQVDDPETVYVRLIPDAALTWEH
jgi:nitroimidazol reductase NimA-like FMN-containing flavoprotein (pyridoxamine 5'-phosphate oxidase superfamily)